jgi:hypothetical protein
MTMKKTVTKEHWRPGLRRVAAPGMVVAFFAGCTPKTTPAEDTADATATADAETAAAPEPVDPPAAVVAQDPQIPLNEAVVGSAPVAQDFYAAEAPPALVVETPPSKPAPTNIWIPGYWWWSPPLARYVWVGGAWRNPPPEQTWFPGSWGLVSPGRYAWTPGIWGPHDFVRDAVVITEGPPVLRVETYGPAPGVGYFWRPGYYGYQTGSYVWVGGIWARPPVVGLGWVEPRYVGVWGHYYFQPGRWDFAAEARGTVYLPDINVRAGEPFHPVPAPVAVVSAHVGYVSACARAISHGAVRTPSGGYVPPAAGVAAHGGVGGHAEAHTGAGTEEHGGAEAHGSASAEVHGGAEAHGSGPAEAHGGGSPEVHGGSGEAHGGAAVHPATPPKPTAAPAAQPKSPSAPEKKPKK